MLYIAPTVALGRRWGRNPLIINKVIQTVRTHTHIITVTTITETRTARNEVEVDLVGKTDAAMETVAEDRKRPRPRNGGKTVGRTVGVRRTHAIQFKGNRAGEHLRDHTIITQ